MIQKKKTRFAAGFFHHYDNNDNSDLVQLRHRQIQQLHAELAEVDVRAGSAATAFDVDDHALAELGVRHVLANAPA